LKKEIEKNQELQSDYEQLKEDIYHVIEAFDIINGTLSDDGSKKECMEHVIKKYKPEFMW
jgi:hypothetical protein